MRLLDLLFMVSLLMPCAPAQEGKAAIPILGLTYDAQLKAIRTIYGFPGAAVVGEPIDTGLPLAAASSRQRLAIGYSQRQRQVRLVRLRDGVAETLLFPAAIPDATSIAFSPSGDSAVLIGATVQVLAGLTSAHVTLRPAIAPPAGTAPVAAVSDDGQSVLLSSGGEAGDRVWLATGEDMLQIAAPGSIVAAAFREGTSEAAAITRSGDLYLITGSNAEVRLLLAGDARTADPVAVYVAADGQRIYTANRSGTIATIDRATGSVATLSCGCVPSTFDPLGSGALFRMSELAEGPLWVFDGGGATPRMWFIPEDAPAAERRQR